MKIRNIKQNVFSDEDCTLVNPWSKDATLVEGRHAVASAAESKEQLGRRAACSQHRGGRPRLTGRLYG